MKDKELEALLDKVASMLDEVQVEEECFRNLVGKACRHCELGRLYEEIQEYKRKSK